MRDAQHRANGVASNQMESSEMHELLVKAGEKRLAYRAQNSQETKQ
jgi:hypothetical protein